MPDQLPTLREARAETERDLIVAALLKARGNISAAARELEISRPTLHDLMKKRGVTRFKLDELLEKLPGLTPAPADGTIEREATPCHRSETATEPSPPPSPAPGSGSSA